VCSLTIASQDFTGLKNTMRFKMKTMIYCAIGAAALSALYVGWTLTARSAYEAAAYKSISRDSEFEIRQYPDIKLASTSMTSPAANGEDGSFMRLFGYISGANESQQKVSMTVPVFMEAETTGESGRMGFVLPREVASSSIPAPASDQVEITTREGGQFAVLRFNGYMSQQQLETAEVRLREWIADEGLTPAGSAEFAGYDPPWAPGLLRRNEVLLRVE